MRVRWLKSFAIAVGCAGFAVAAEGPTIAVLDIEGKGVSADEASVLTDKLRGERTGIDWNEPGPTYRDDTFRYRVMPVSVLCIGIGVMF